MENTFKKLLKFQVADIDTTSGDVIYKPVEKPASFYKLSQNDPRQARLFFMLRPLYRQAKMIGDNEMTFIADPNVLYDLTIAAINALLIVDEKEFTEIDKKEFLNDNFAVMAFGEWFLEDSAPFFVNYMLNYRSYPTIPKPPEMS